MNNRLYHTSNERRSAQDCLEDTKKLQKYGIEVKGEDGEWFELRNQTSFDKGALKALAISLGYLEYRLLTK